MACGMTVKWQSAEEQLQNAIFHGLFEKARVLLGQGFVPLDGTVCLKALMRYGQYDLFRSLLSRVGTCVNYDLIYFAAYNGYEQFSRDLVSRSSLTNVEYVNLMSIFLDSEGMCAELAKKARPTNTILLDSIGMRSLGCFLDLDLDAKTVLTLLEAAIKKREHESVRMILSKHTGVSESDKERLLLSAVNLLPLKHWIITQEYPPEWHSLSVRSLVCENRQVMCRACKIALERGWQLSCFEGYEPSE